jgi:hypothetical protein
MYNIQRELLLLHIHSLFRLLYEILHLFPFYILENTPNCSRKYRFSLNSGYVLDRFNCLISFLSENNATIYINARFELLPKSWLASNRKLLSAALTRNGFNTTDSNARFAFLLECVMFRVLSCCLYH